MERDPFDRDQGGSDVGRDFERDYGDEPPAAIRDAAPDYLAPIDDIGPGQRPHPAARERAPRPPTRPSTTGSTPRASCIPRSGRSERRASRSPRST